MDKAAVLLVRLTKNHPLPDGNKRAAWVTFRMFVEINGYTWRDFPTVDQSEELMIAIASGQRGEEWVSTWLASRLHHSDARDQSGSD